MVETGQVLEHARRLAAGSHHDPHVVLGPHRDQGRGGLTIRAWLPGAERVELLLGGRERPLRRIDDVGLFEVVLRTRTIPRYRFRVSHGADSWEYGDPYRLPPTLSDVDLHLIGEGRHERLWEVLGAHPAMVDGEPGVAFAVWAPAAAGVAVVGPWNAWDNRRHPLRSLGASGVWELSVPGLRAGDLYKFAIRHADGTCELRADPLARAAELAPATASRVASSTYAWQDATWLAGRKERQSTEAPIAVYEVHLASWRSGRTMAELAIELPAYVAELGFTHVELMPVMEHPFGGSWGYQVTGYYAPSARLGEPDDLRRLIDAFHAAGIGVILDWVPGHFPRDPFALAAFDGTALYEHADPRRGAHPDWGTLIFNYGRHEVRNFLVANALYWIEEFHADGLRVDAVASMLYLDYSRAAGEWLPNEAGGNENLEAIAFLRELNTVVYGRHPDVMTIAEESTAWPGVTQPVHDGGLGFGYKWNLGFMHDSLAYIQHDPIHRRYHHGELTFPFVYAGSENYLLPISHDEVVHGKGSLLSRMPGDDWQRFANLRAYLAYMWAHPGKKLLFMGCELGQAGEWDHDGSLDWGALVDPRRRGIQLLVGDLNRLLSDRPALHVADREPAGVNVIDAANAAENVVAFARFGEGDVVVCVANFAPVPRTAYVLGLPQAGRWVELLNTDSTAYAGSGVGNLGVVEATAEPYRYLPARATITLPPLAVVWLAPG